MIKVGYTSLAVDLFNLTSNNSLYQSIFSPWKVFMPSAYSKNKIQTYGHVIFDKVKEIMLKHNFIGPIWGPNDKLKNKETGEDYRIITLTSDFYNGCEQDHRPLMEEILDALSEYQCRWFAVQYDHVGTPEILSLELYFPTALDGETPIVLPPDLLLPLSRIRRNIKGNYYNSPDSRLQKLIDSIEPDERDEYSGRVARHYETLPEEFWKGLTTPI